MRSGVAGPTRLRIVRRSSSAALRFSFFLLTNSGRNNDPDKLFLVHGAGATMCVGELHEAITHDSFNGGAADCCRSVAHNSCPRLGLGLARRMGMGRGLGLAAGALIGSAIAASSYGYYGYGYPYYGYGYGYPAYGYGYPAYGYGYGTGYYGGYRYAYRPVIRRHIYAFHPVVRRHWRY